MNIITYSPHRDRFGRFRSIKWKKLAWKLIKTEFVILSLVMNVHFMADIYNLKCSEGGWFMRKSDCHDLYTTKMDMQEYARKAMLQDTSDSHISEGNKQALRDWDQPIQN